MDIRKLYQRWQRLGTPSEGLTARAVVMAAREKECLHRKEQSACGFSHCSVCGKEFPEGNKPRTCEC